jgi:uncharacterized protein
MMLLMPPDKRYELLKTHIAPYSGAVVAFSGGTDSTLLLAAANDALKGNITAVTWQTEVTSDEEIDAAMRLAEQLGVSHRVVSDSFLENEAAAANPVDRCYHCRKHMYEGILKVYGGADSIVIMEGVNVDDLSDTRPGLRAAREIGVVHPMVEAGLTKNDVREISRTLGLPNWDKEAAPCLASRIAYGVRVTSVRLNRVERAEGWLRQQGYRNVRVRLLDDVHATIEVARDQVAAAQSDLLSINSFLCELGFALVEVDPRGYRMGSMNSEVASSPKNQAPRNDVERENG